LGRNRFFFRDHFTLSSPAIVNERFFNSSAGRCVRT
jgi:hypothetical protein